MPEQNSNGGGTAVACALCGKRPQAPEYRPFCSKRCADIDLHRWLGGVYAVPATEDSDEDGESHGGADNEEQMH